jgi:hypothetical protein
VVVEVMETTTFKNLRVGDTFHFSRNPESGLTDLDKPGRVTYVKTSARGWSNDNEQTGKVGSINARVWVVTP